MTSSNCFLYIFPLTCPWHVARRPMPRCSKHSLVPSFSWLSYFSDDTTMDKLASKTSPHACCRISGGDVQGVLSKILSINSWLLLFPVHSDSDQRDSDKRVLIYLIDLFSSWQWIGLTSSGRRPSVCCNNSRYPETVPNVPHYPKSINYRIPR